MKKMVDPSLVSYVKENLAKGYPHQQIRDTLVGSGWLAADVDAALREAAPAAIAPVSLPSPAAAPPASSAFPTAEKPTEKPYYEPKKFGIRDALIIAAMVIVFAGIGAVIYFLFLVN